MTKRALAFALALAALAPSAALAKTDARPDLWATVNLCDTPARPGAVGIRVSIPREKGAPEQWARIHLQWFDGSKLAWRALRAGGDAGWRRPPRARGWCCAASSRCSGATARRSSIARTC